ncbi:sporulation kinase [Gracilibacillus halophilus YIM-C55.5]|uniref:histidine kinase n=1 Tax=Gracilibacillus halophilus YIM-C55.5 TaxID=1308866 RepID=N4W9K9_9BACI|nr:ATP-binding protein [Gracilibacillus halophilus]ENH96968.1 sporulation kinase [Gracilibacillus halophilus YIM-C55.5]
MLNHVDDDNQENETSYSNNDTLTTDQLPKSVLQAITKHGFDLITVCDISGHILFLSDSIERVLGYEKNELLGTSVFRYILQEDKEYIVKHIDLHQTVAQPYYIHIRNDVGKYIIFETMITILKWHDGRKYILTISRDISDKKQAEEMLIRSEKMSIAGQLAAGIAHEIRNPLTSLKGFVQLLQAGISSKEEYYKIMIDEIEKINTITSELLFISKPMTDEKNLENVKEMLQDVVTLLQTQANLYDIQLTLNVSDKLDIYCDRSQMKQVFINLIKNAIEEMTNGGTIEIDVTHDDKWCVISIIDEGPGVPKHLLHKLKEPFFTTKKNGTGLGLMISNQIIDNHQGQLDIQSNPSKGSTFRIYLPNSSSY